MRPESRCRKSQSAMEYLMTYGWSILIIAIVLAALFSLGVFSSSNLGARVQPNNCRVFRPNGPGTTTNINLEGVCNGELPEYVSYFNGVSGYLNMGSSSGLKPAGNVTFSAWILFKGSGGSADNYILSSGGQTSSTGIFFIFAGTQLEAGVKTATNSVSIGNLGSWPTNQWYFITGTFNSATDVLTGYVNATYEGQATATSASNSNVDPIFAIGTPNNNLGAYLFNGSIANVQIYNQPLDAAAIKSLYLEGIGGAPIEPQNLVAWWPLNGDTNDYGGNGYSGNAVNVNFISQWGSGYSTP